MYLKNYILILCLVVPIWTEVVPRYKLGPRIINGDKASKGQFPWQAAIYVTQPGVTNLCGGALVNKRWILTAGHCVIDASNFKIALGSNQLSGDDSSRVVYESKDYILHESYDKYTLANDIGLIKLPEDVTFTDDIQPIALTSSEPDDKTTVRVSGWGLTSDDGEGASPDLMYVDLVTIPDSVCASEYDGSLNKGVVCASGPGSVVQSTCEGDSGGPLIIDYVVPLHVGIVSFGHPDGCESGKPAGFTRTFYFKDWIKEKTGL